MKVKTENKKRLPDRANKNDASWWLGHLLRLMEQGQSQKSGRVTRVRQYKKTEKQYWSLTEIGNGTN